MTNYFIQINGCNIVKFLCSSL